MSDECEKCGEHPMSCTCACENKWLCASCFKKAFNLDDDFDWRKVGVVYFRCQKCGDDPVIFVEYDDMIECANEGEPNDG